MNATFITNVIASGVALLAAGQADNAANPPGITDAWPKSAEFWTVVVGAACVTIVACFWFVVASLRRTSTGPVAERDTLRLLTVVVLAIVAGNLALLGKADGQQVLILFAAIAGFILGTSADKRIALQRMDDTCPSSARHHPSGPTITTHYPPHKPEP